MVSAASIALEPTRKASAKSRYAASTSCNATLLSSFSAGRAVPILCFLLVFSGAPPSDLKMGSLQPRCSPGLSTEVGPGNLPFEVPTLFGESTCLSGGFSSAYATAPRWRFEVDR
jgi:hypothetical protein